MDFSYKRFLPEIFGIAVVFLCHRRLRLHFPEWAKRIRFSEAFCYASLLFNLPYIWRLLPPGPLFEWLRASGMLWAMTSAGVSIAYELFRHLNPAQDPVRRRLLQTTAMAAPALALGYGTFYERRILVPKEVDLKIPGLPKDLDGLRISQVSDIHMGGFFAERDLVPAIDIANAFRPHLTFVTGDLITREGDPLDDCLRQLKRLKAEAGVFGCMGNHEIYGNCEEYVEQRAAALGIRFLRDSAESLCFGQARMRLAGVDYQRYSRPYLTTTARLREPAAFNVLLSHNPDVFDVSAAQGWDLTIAGHTHGGQVTVEYLNQHLNLARFFTPYVYGHYQKENAHLYVTRGIGTVGVPVRIGAVPEVALIRLCAT